MNAEHQPPVTAGPADGAVTGGPRALLRWEGLVLFAGALLGFTTTGQPWWLLPLTILLPDLAAVGYLHNSRTGARLYNAAHSTIAPAAILAVGLCSQNHLATTLGLIWLAHIGMDRALGYGLKYQDRFQHTHLGRLVRASGDR